LLTIVSLAMFSIKAKKDVKLSYFVLIATICLFVGMSSAIPFNMIQITVPYISLVSYFIGIKKYGSNKSYQE
jgi:predicted membrane channel-forming protein YqfA (hemolysin III family)